MLVGQKLGVLMVKRRKKDLTFIRDLLATGRIRPVIDRRYRLSEVPEALRYREQGPRAR
jgi:NADPH:quinone reductase-like Zn-dependent oxidoreductase